MGAPRPSRLVKRGRKMNETTRCSRVKAILRVTSGNFLEMYDFMVFAYYARAISKAFFPSSNPFASLMLTLVTFGAGYLMRPLGAIVLGAYVDTHGRRKGLLVTLSLMACGTLLIAAVPGYAQIGVFAPLLVLAGRLLQGFSAGAELGGVSVYLAEIAPPGKKGFYVAWQSGSQQVAVIFAALLGVVLTSHLTPAEMGQWGWRVPFFIGCMIVPLLFMVRRKLEETNAFQQRRRRLSTKETFQAMGREWRLVVGGCLTVAMATTFFYLITAYTPLFGRNVLHFSQFDSLLITVCVGVSNLFWLPVSGALTDRIGRKPLLFTVSIIAILTAYPAMLWLINAPSFGKLFAFEMWLSFLYASYNGALVVWLTEIMPLEVRTAGFSLAWSLATAIFGGFTPAISTALIHSTGNKAAPALWLSFAAVCALLATWSLTRNKRLANPALAAEEAA
jgi:metabolite-proton symporter